MDRASPLTTDRIADLRFGSHFDADCGRRGGLVRSDCALIGAPWLVTRDLQTHSNGVDEIVRY
jgi:hypothetical protein